MGVYSIKEIGLMLDMPTNTTVFLNITKVGK